MAATDYIHEKICVAAECLRPSNKEFEIRLFDAWVSALGRLFSTDAPADIAEELSVVLLICQNHLSGDGRMSKLSDADRCRLLENMLWVLLQTTNGVGHD